MSMHIEHRIEKEIELPEKEGFNKDSSFSLLNCYVSNHATFSRRLSCDDHVDVID